METEQRTIRDMLPAGAILPGDAAYDGARISFNGTRAAGLPIAIRGGGHSVAGHSLPDDALVVSLDRMRRVDVDPERMIVHAGGGALWEDLDGPAFAHGLAVPGGTFGDTGIGGLTLGGGLGWLMPIAGLTCDNLVEAELVTADGTVVTAGANGDPELLWALRGGGGNFGVVTRFSYRLTPVASMWGGTIVYSGSAAHEVFARLTEVMAAHPTAMMPTVGIHREPEHGPAVSILVGIVDGSDPNEIAALLRRDAPILSDDLGPRTYLELQAQAGILPFGLRHYWKGHFLRELDSTMFERLVESIGAEDAVGAAFILLVESSPL